MATSGRPIPPLRVLFFDVFGTCVAQRTPVADALWRAAKETLESDGSSLSSEVRAKAEKMTYEEWFEFGGEWNKDVDVFTSESKAKHNNVDWKAVDKYRFASLHKLLAHRGLLIREEDANANTSTSTDTTTSELRVKDGSLWTESQLQQLGLVWHRLPPWADTRRGLELLNGQFSTVTLSNTYQELMESLVAHSSIPFQHVYTADMWNSFKPNPKVYLGAAEKMGVKPEECALVAAHLNDLKGAKACGFYAIYVERPLEEKNPELREDNIPDLWIREEEEEEEEEGGFVALAARLGI